MKLNKRQTYFAVLIAGLIVCLLYQSLWIFSRTSRAEIHALYKSRSDGIAWMRASYTVNYETHSGLYLRDGFDVDKRFFEIRYLLFLPGWSRTNNFTSNWGPLIMLFILWFIFATIVFVRKDIISDQAEFLLNPRPPFLKLANNEIKDFDQHDVIHESLNDEEKIILESIQLERVSSNADQVRTAVYQFNPNAIIILVSYVFCAFLFVISLLSQQLGLTTALVFGLILIVIPQYMQNTRNPKTRMKIPDSNALIFSLRGVGFGKYFCPLAKIESAVVYLESFDGFICRDRTTTGKSKTRFYGDNNKISFRNNGQVTDFTFILNTARDYWTFKNMMAGWASNGINVILQVVFEDEFIIQEMVHFHIPGA